MDLSQELARRLLAELSGEHDPAVVPLLAAALAEGLGVVPDPTPGSRRLYLVLASPFEAMAANDPDFLPVFLVAERSARQRQYLRKTGAVASWFRTRARGGRNLRPPGPASRKWARAATQSFAPVPIDGDLWSDPPTSPDPDGFGQYEWYSLKEAPVGHIIYRIDSTRVLTLFQRLTIERKLWGRVVAPAHADAVDVYGIMAAMKAEFGGNLELPEVDALIPAMAVPPTPPELSPLLRSWRARRRHRSKIAAAS